MNMMWIIFDDDIAALQRKYFENKYPKATITRLFLYHRDQAIPVDTYAGQFEAEIYVPPAEQYYGYVAGEYDRYHYVR